MISQNDKIDRLIRSLAIFLFLTLLELTAVSPAAAAYTVTPSTWNVIGLDSNTPASGPYRFPVGAKVCGGTSGSSDTAAFTWDAGGTDNGAYIYLRAGSANPVTITFGADGCADAYFEVEVNKISAAFDQTRRYHITAGGVSTTTPRELYVEHLVSQSRNAIDYVYLNGVSVLAGGSMNLMVGNTYTIQLVGHTAPGGYNQFEEFINFPNTIFQVISVSTDYTTNDSPYVTTTGHKYLYADACRWENDPNSPYYRSCWEGWKSGASVTTTYSVKILSGGGATETLTTLLYDFSGSSFHYNSDFSTGARFANIIDPTAVTISKSFSPGTTNAGGVSTLTFTLTNPNAGAMSGLNFIDVFPTSPGAMTLASTTTTNTCGGTLTDNSGAALAVGSAGIKLSNGVIPASSSCMVQVSVTPPATGSYTNTSNHLFVDALDTGKFATATLTVNSTPPPPSPSSACTTPVQLAAWNLDALAVGANSTPAYSSKASDVSTATATLTGGTGWSSAISNTYSSSASNSWASQGYTTASTATSATATYTDFVLDTSNYGGVGISYSAKTVNGNWGGTNHLYSYSKADAGAFTLLRDTTPMPTAWTAYTNAASSTGTGTTTFRINAAGSKSNPSYSYLYLDDIIFTGCTRPDPTKLTITKSFAANPVAVGGTSTLTFTITNSNATSTASLTNISFTDTLPASLTVATGSSAQCGGTLTNTNPSTLSFAGGTLAPGANCTVTATITAATAGPHQNVSGFISSTQSGSNTSSTGVATATLTAVLPPSISKLFAPNPILANVASTLTFTITNPNQNNSLSGVAFTDTFPATMVVANPTGATTSGCGAPTYAPVAGAASVSFSSGTIAAAGTCYVTVNVTVPATGSYVNTSAVVSATTAGNGNTASDTLTVSAPHPQIAILKQVSNNAGGPWSSYLALPTGSNVYYQFTVENPGDVDLTAVSVTDPAFGGTVCSPGNLVKYATTTCTAGPVAAVAGIHLNTATASGTYSGTPYTDWSIAAYATTGVTIAKSATQTYFTAAGNVLNYSYLVTNSGSASLAGPVTVADNKTTVTCPAVSTVGDGDNWFDSGESLTCTATYTVVAADVTAKAVTNTASATVSGVISSTASKTIPLAPDLTAVKTNNVSGQVIIGGSFNWTLTVTNAASAGAASFSDTQTLLTDDLPTSGANYAAPATATNAGGTTGTINCAIATNTLTCTASGAVTIPSGGSFSITIAVTTTAAGSLVNPKSGGICKADSLTVVSEIDETNNTCADTVAVLNLPSLTIVKSVAPYSDPVNGTTSAKAIPGAFMTYTITVINSGAGSVDNNTTVITDPIPANTELFVGDINGAGSGPVLFTTGNPLCSAGTAASGLSYSFISLADITDNISFSDDGGVSYGKVNTAPDANQCDTTVTHLKVSLTGIFNGTAASGGSNTSFCLQFRVRVK